MDGPSASNDPRDPHDAIREAENALRDLIGSVLLQVLGANWLESSGLTPERLDTIRQRQQEEQKRRSLQRAEDRPLFYSDLPDLRKIIHKNWDSFEPIFHDRTEFQVFINRLEDLRNPDAHQRGLWPYEVDLAFGISGQIRQAIAISRKQVDVSLYYPRFERAVDNFGFTCLPEGYRTKNTQHPVLAGDIITYLVSAWNPNPLEPLEFRLQVGNRATEWTTSNTVSTHLDQYDIDRSVGVVVLLRSARARALGKAPEDQLMFTYLGIPD